MRLRRLCRAMRSNKFQAPATFSDAYGKGIVETCLNSLKQVKLCEKQSLVVAEVFSALFNHYRPHLLVSSTQSEGLQKCSDLLQNAESSKSNTRDRTAYTV